MWWARSEQPVQVWLGAGRVAWLAPATEAEVHLVDDELAAVTTVVGWSGRLARRARLIVWLGGDLCKLDRVPAIADAADFSEAAEAVAARFDLGDAAKAGWRAVLAESPAAAEFWRVAVVRSDVVDGLRRELGGNVASIRPWWSSALSTIRTGALQSGSQVPLGGDTLYAYDGASLTICSWGGDGQVTEAETIGPIGSLPAARRLVLRRRSTGLRGQVRCATLDFSGPLNPVPELGMQGGAVLSTGDAQAEVGLTPWVRWSDEF